MMKKIWDIIHKDRFVDREVGPAVNCKGNYQGSNSPGVALWVQFSYYLIFEMITQCQNNNGHLGFMLHTTLTKYVLQSMKNFNASNVNLQLH